MSQEPTAARREKYREYTRKRYENDPERHERDKERYRQYILKRRQDPNYRKMECERRRERRRMKRESLKGGSAAAASTPANGKRTTRSTKTTPTTRSKIRADSQMVDKWEDTLKEEVNNSQSPANGDTTVDCCAVIKKSESSLTIPDDCESDDSFDDDMSEGQLLPDALDDRLRKTVDIIKEHSNNTINITPMTNQSITPMVNQIITPTVPPISLPPCDCSQSNALHKLASMSRELSINERRRFETGLLQYMEDFMNSPPPDTFMMLISDKLKRIPEDHRPDLEVAILVAINSALKNK